MSFAPLVQTPELRLAAKVAWMYHNEQKKQTVIADELHISQSRVSRLLKLAVAKGIVRTMVFPPTGVFTELEGEVERAFGLDECILVEARGTEEAVVNDLGIAAATYLQTTLGRREVIGISSWSNSWLQAIQKMSAFKEQAATQVVQLVGGVGDPRVQTQATLLLTHLASLTGADPVFLQTPGIVQGARIQRSLLADPSTAPARRAWEGLTTALVGIGSVEPSPLLRDSGTVDARVEAEVRHLGGIGDVCFHYFDADGRLLRGGVDGRIVGISAERLRAVPRKIGVAGGERKQQAVLAAARGGWVDILITDTATARFMLARADGPGGGAGGRSGAAGFPGPAPGPTLAP